VSSDSRFVVTNTGIGNEAQIFEMETGKLRKTLSGHSDIIRSMAISQDSQFAVTGSQDHAVKIWNLSSGNLLKTFAEHPKPGTVGKNQHRWQIRNQRIIRW
jgi:WD40 repeat protein